jgi:hypothetical protein
VPTTGIISRNIPNPILRESWLGNQPGTEPLTGFDFMNAIFACRVYRFA